LRPEAVRKNKDETAKQTELLGDHKSVVKKIKKETEPEELRRIRLQPEGSARQPAHLHGAAH
jgi:hypothetical protein